MWRPDGPQGNESAKIRFEVLPYCAQGGLDVGCGPVKVWTQMIGLDSCADTALFGIQMKPDMRIADATKLRQFADASMPCVFSAHLLEHIVDYQAALKEWWRLVETGGHFVLYLPHADLYPRIGQPGANPDHKHDFKPDDIIDFCRLAFPDWSLLVNETRDQGNEYSFLLVLRKEAPGTGQTEPWQAPKPLKTAGIVRLGGNGDALWSASVAKALHAQGHAVTAYCAANGADVLRHDPHIARIIELPHNVLNDEDLLDYWANEAPKYTKWVNLIGSVEHRLLPHQSQSDFYLPQAVRHRLMDGNYLDMVHAYADLPPSRQIGSGQKFYPSAAEAALAAEFRAKLAGPLVVISPTGSGPFKTWPHAQHFMRMMARHGVYTVMLGDLTGLPDLEPITLDGIDYGHVIGREWPLRIALAYALTADAVVATESVFANAVAYEDMLKVVMLSHSSNENLTRDWTNTVALEAPVACHPCHRIHNASSTMCGKDKITGASACMAYYSADLVADLVLKHLGIARRTGKTQKATVVDLREAA